MPNRSAALAPDLIISVKSMERRPGTSRQQSIEFPAPANLGTAVIGIPEGQAVELQLLLESVLEGVLATGTVRSGAQGECVRCLGPVEFPVEATFQELYVYPERAYAAADAGDRDQDQLEVVEDQLDLNPPVRDAVILALPFGPLCREDCEGLCSECGTPLGQEPGHAHQAVDPRWAVLEDLLEDRREES
ncbi:MAG: YceD family protein [Bifidobacteriaceae bacterium]|jgi:uncharacterized protein|nr:YceD family protein [Bifidobacteriaceae bacterium]